MRTDWKVMTLSLGLLSACSERSKEPATITDDLKRDLAVASASGGDLATAPQSYRRVRFVSDIEQSRAAVPAKRPKPLHHHATATASAPAAKEALDVALDPVVSMASESPEPAVTPEAPAPAPAVVIAQAPAPDPIRSPSGPSSEGSMGDGGHGGGLGGLLGGIIGAVVIRGGHGGVDKCDPRTDGRARPPMTDRPTFGMPLPVGRPTFPGSRR